MMEKETDGEKPLAIPANCPPVEYAINGFTWKEIGYVAITGMAAFLAGAYLFLKKDSPMSAAFLVLFAVFAAIIFFGRDKYTENMPDKIRILFRDKRMPGKYEYVYYNIYEGRMCGKEEKETKEGRNGNEPQQPENGAGPGVH